MHDILQKIIEKKRFDLGQKKKNTGLFKEKILSAKDIALIAEVKFASPTNPHLGSPEALFQRVKQYQSAGADAISVITEKHFFKGDPSFVTGIKEVVSLPVLQKDFVIDPSQIYEAKHIGSDALLLIARLVDEKTLQQFVSLAQSLGIEPVVEITHEEDLRKAISTTTKIIAVNARDLETFIVDVAKACLLMKQIPDRFIKLGFSGIHSATEVTEFKKAGARGVLVGTSLMQAKDIRKFIRSLQVLPKPRYSEANLKVKICGIQSMSDAEKAIAAGADMIGFIFVKDSKRYIEPSVAKAISLETKGKVKTVGVFKNHSLKFVTTLSKELSLDYVQLHGEEDAQFCQKITVPIIKSFSVATDFSVNELIKKMSQYQVMAYLLDRAKPGEGEKVPLEKARLLAKSFPIIFAGGLTAETVGDVVKKVRPFGVDVAGGVKRNTIVDRKKVQTFVQQAKGAFV